MNSVYFSCGCSISKSMFPPYTIFSVSPCMGHSQEDKIQSALRTISDIILNTQKEKAKV